jgi:dUTP pyrophosphatase
LNSYTTNHNEYTNESSVTTESQVFYMPSIKIYTYPDAKMPTVSTQGSGGLDLFVYDYKVEDHQTTVFTGAHVEIPLGHVGLVMPRSSTGTKGFRLKNTVGVIDADYRGEIRLVCDRFENEEDVVEVGAKIAQLVILPVCPFPVEQVSSLEDLSETERGANGFGSTGL